MSGAESEIGSEGLTERAARAALDSRRYTDCKVTALMQSHYRRMADAVLAVVWPEVYAAFAKVRRQKSGEWSVDRVDGWDAALDAVEAEIRKLADGESVSD